MFRNAYFDQYRNVIHLWETKNNERTYEKIPFVPYMFIENRDPNSEIKSIFDKGVVKKKFKSYKEYKEYSEKNIDNDVVFENNVSPELQFLAERYHSIDDDKMEMIPLRINIFDIEVVSEKIDETKILNLRYKGSESGNLYTYMQYLKSFENEKDIEYFNEKNKKWEEFTEEAFNIRGGFPGAEEAEWPISLISCYDTFTSKLYSFGVKEYTGKYLNEDWFVYTQCDNEIDLITKYIETFHMMSPDIITGWNIIRFDLPYIFNRVKRLFEEESNLYITNNNIGDDIDDEARKEDLITETKDKIINMGEELLKKFSPINRVNCWKKMVGISEITMIDIPGVTIIDYCMLYKQYSKTLLRINLESYRLDFVSKYELGEGKLEYKDDYGNLTELYNKNFNLYTEYNAIDNIRVKEIQDKRKFIEIVQLLSLVAKFPMKYYEAVTTVIEGIFLTYYRRHNLAAEHFYGGIKENFEAAYVKEPQIGLHGYGCDIDIKSSYPHGMITLNMGNESYVGIIKKIMDADSLLDTSEELVIHYTSKREYPDFIYQTRKKEEIIVSSKYDTDDIKNKKMSLKSFNKKLKDGDICIAPNGAMFSTRKQSCLADIQKTLFNRRVEYKNTMKKWGIKADELRQQYAKTNDESLKAEIYKAQNEYDKFKALQIVIKLLINSMYGALSVPYFRGYNLSIAEAICAVGRLAIKNGMKFVNIVLNDTRNSKDLCKTLEELRSKGK